MRRNQERDQAVWQKLEAKGWFVIIVWECQLKRTVMDETVARVQAEIIRNGNVYRDRLNERKKAREIYLKECKDRRARESALMSEIKGNS